MYTIKMDYDQVDAIIRDVFKNDYISLCKDANILAAIENRQPFEDGDLEFNRRIIEAMRVVAEYYFSENERKEIFGA